MKRASIEAVLADEGHESGVPDWRSANTDFRASHEGQCLRALGTQRDDHAPARRQLCDEWQRNLGTARSDQNRMIGCVRAPPQGPIADEQRTVRDTRRLQRYLSAGSETAHTLDGEHLSRERRQERRLIPRACSDLEHALFAFQAERLEIPCLRKRLRDCLTSADRQRGILIGAMAHGLGDEEMSRRRGEGSQDGEVADALRAKLLDESHAIATICVAAAGHFFFLPRSHFPTTSSSL